MVKSKFKTWGIVALCTGLIIISGTSFFIYGVVTATFFDGHIIKLAMSKQDALKATFCFGILLILMVFAVLRYFFVVKIDIENKSIEFKHLLTRQKTGYAFTDLDGYLETFATTRNGNYKVFYFIKNKKAEKLITGYYYSNMNEMKDALSLMKYLGFEKDFGKLNRRSLFNKQLID